MLARWAAAALLPAGPTPAPARCLNWIPVRVEVRSKPGRSTVRQAAVIGFAQITRCFLMPSLLPLRFTPCAAAV